MDDGIEAILGKMILEELLLSKFTLLPILLAILSANCELYLLYLKGVGLKQKREHQGNLSFTSTNFSFFQNYFNSESFAQDQSLREFNIITIITAINGLAMFWKDKS